MVLASLATAVSTAKCWLCCPYPSCVHRQFLPSKQDQVRAAQLFTVPVPKGDHALSSGCQWLCCCRVPGQPRALKAVDLITKLPVSQCSVKCVVLEMLRCSVILPVEASDLLIFSDLLMFNSFLGAEERFRGPDRSFAASESMYYHKMQFMLCVTYPQQDTQTMIEQAHVVKLHLAMCSWFYVCVD